MTLLLRNHYLLSVACNVPVSLRNFAGVFLTSSEELTKLANKEARHLFLCGEFEDNENLTLSGFATVSIIFSHSTNYASLVKRHPFIRCIEDGLVPLSIHNLGIYWPSLFDDTKDNFVTETTEHQLQRLTLHDNVAKAIRTGFYASEVKDTSEGREFRLLRCSSNFEGPTNGFKEFDRYVIRTVHAVAQPFFSKPLLLNHLLVQAYHNNAKTQAKASIAPHSDKTKDMPNSLEFPDINPAIAFCTFYEGFQGGRFLEKPSLKRRGFDFCLNNKARVQTSALTSIHFKRKACVTDATLMPEFTLTLYPNSCFIIPMSTNRLYTHAIVPSLLPVEHLPTRLSMVLRGSCRRALYNHDGTFIFDEKTKAWLKMVDKPTREDIDKLKAWYLRENAEAEEVIYPQDILFSMNEGDLLQPLL